jgi:hypothetical protein
MTDAARQRMRDQFLGTLIMASFFAMAVITYAVGLFVTGRPSLA